MSSSPKKLVVVIGATGTQGGNVIKGLLKHSDEYRLRAITRDPSKAAAKAFAAQGVEVFQADINNLASMRTAFSGAYAIFAYTNFFDTPFTSEESYAQNEIAEEQQGKNLALAAAATPSLEHYLWSATPDGWTHEKIRFFDSKSRVTAFIKKDLPDLWKKTTEIWVGFMYENYVKFNPFLGPMFKGNGSYYELAINLQPTSVLGSVSCEDLGPFVHFVVQSKNKYQAQTIALVAEELVESARLATWGAAVNRRVVFTPLTTAEYATRIAAFGVPQTVAEGFADLYELFSEVGNAYSGEGVIQAREVLPKGFLKSWDAYVKENDWQGILGTETKA